MKDSEKQYIHPTRIFKKPEELANTWQQYKESLKEEAKEWPQYNYVGRDGTLKIHHPKVPLTLKGFYTYCRQTGVGKIEQYFVNQGELYDDFMSITRAIKDEIEADLTKGGLMGFYNSQLTARINGFVDKHDVQGSVIKIEGLPKDIEEDLEEE